MNLHKLLCKLGWHFPIKVLLCQYSWSKHIVEECKSCGKTRELNHDYEGGGYKASEWK